MNYNPILEYLGPEIESYPTGIQAMLEQMGELMERTRRMILDYNVWASTQPNHLDCMSLLKDMRIRPGYRPDSERTYNPNAVEAAYKLARGKADAIQHKLMGKRVKDEGKDDADETT